MLEPGKIHTIAACNGGCMLPNIMHITSTQQHIPKGKEFKSGSNNFDSVYGSFTQQSKIFRRKFPTKAIDSASCLDHYAKQLLDFLISASHVFRNGTLST
jgi:hypothetical protein